MTRTWWLAGEWDHGAALSRPVSFPTTSVSQSLGLVGPANAANDENVGERPRRLYFYVGERGSHVHKITLTTGTVCRPSLRTKMERNGKRKNTAWFNVV